MTPFPGPGRKWQISKGGIVGLWCPCQENYVIDWSADGKNLRYKQFDGIYNVEVHSKGDRLEFSVPKEISALTGDPIVLAILPDGKRILAARRVGDKTSVPIDMILNWQYLVR